MKVLLRKNVENTTALTRTFRLNFTGKRLRKHRIKTMKIANPVWIPRSVAIK